MLGSDRFAFETPNVIDPGDAAPSAPPRRESSASYQQARNSTDRLLSDIDDLELDQHGPSEETQSFLGNNSDAGSLQNNYSHHSASPTSFTNTEKLYFDDPNTGNDYKESSGCAEHSLPSVEEARTYAVSLLHTADRAGGSSSMDPFARAVQLAGPTKNNGEEPRRSRLANFGRKKRSHGPNGSFDSNINDLNVSIDSARSASSKHLVRNQVLAFLGKILLVVMLLILFGLMIALITHLTQERRSESSSSSAPQIPTTPLTRLEQTYAFLHTQLLTHPTDLLTEGSPHFLAANWIADMDVLEKDVPASIEDASAKAFVQRYVLALLYYSTSGPNKWRNKASFLTEQLECGWYDNQHEIAGFAAGKKYSMGVTCNEDLEVVNLLLPTNALSGSIPEEIGYLSSLTLLSFPHNELEGSLPSTLSMLTNLQFFDVKFNFIKGSIPDVFGSANKLRILGLSNNYFEDKLPSSMSNLSQLRTLAIDDNLFNGNLDALQSMSSLEYLYADRNSFVDVVDDAFFASMPNLREVDVSGNELTINGIFPAHLLQHPTLRIADFANNRFQGALPDNLNVNEKLEFLSFRNNELTGSVSATSLPQLVELKHLDLQGNLFSDRMPSMISLSKLSYLFLGDNPMLDPGPIPSWLFELKQIRELGMSNMRLTNDVPYWLEEMDQLTFLDLSNNQLQGVVPRSVFDLPNLAYLLLHNNTLSGVLPTQIVGAEKMLMLTLFDNGFSGDVNHVCEEAQDLQLLAVDCTTTCDEDCCPKCCDRSKEDLYASSPIGANGFCFGLDVPTYLQFFEGLWELNYTRAQVSFDPSLLTDDPEDPVHGD